CPRDARECGRSFGLSFSKTVADKNDDSTVLHSKRSTFSRRFCFSFSPPETGEQKGRCRSRIWRRGTCGESVERPLLPPPPPAGEDGQQ
ncbi:unnamed protein product, partial [Ectocarpus sp. 13 AM-2016]